MNESERPPDLVGSAAMAELSTALRQAIAPYTEALRAFEDFRSQIQGWLAEHQVAFAGLGLYLQQLSTLDWRDIDKPAHAAELALAEAGWTISGWMYRQDVLDLSKKTPAEIDIAMTAGLMNDDSKNFESLRVELLNAPALAQWHPLIAEIFTSIKAGLHRVAIPAELTVLEGFVARSLVQRSITGAKDTSPIPKVGRNDWHRKDIEEAFFWESGIAFLNKIFAYSNFSQDEPSLINRHWVLHGRSSKEWTIADALRLVNAMSTLNYLFEEVGWPEGC